MKKRLSLLTIILLLLSSFCFSSIGDCEYINHIYRNSNSKSINNTVHEVGINNQFLKVQDAIDIAEPGDTIFIHPGTYYENITINKTLNIIGSGADLTQIYGLWSESIIYLNADHCNLSNLTITGYGSYSVLLIDGQFNSIKNCILIGNVIGITLKNSNYNSIENCTCISNSGAGLYLGDSNYNTIIDSKCIDSQYGTGIYLFYAFGNKFLNGTCENNSDDGFFAYWLANGNEIYDYTFNNNKRNGVYLLDSGNFLIDNCTSKNNNGSGFVIGSSNNKITNCTSVSNMVDGFYLYHSENSTYLDCKSNFNFDRGFYLRYSNNNLISRNIIISNANLGIRIDANSKNNLLYSNDLINNNNGTQQALDFGSNNKWSMRSKGNYWWDYSFFFNNALNNNVSWNISYVLSKSKGTKDKFPLIKPVTSIDVIQIIQPGLFIDHDHDLVYDKIDAFPNNSSEWRDSDNDGVGENIDSFPNDRAASIDTDGDKFPNSWNVGMSEKDSTTNLRLDEYPNDPNKWENSDENSEICSGLFLIPVIFVLISIFIIIFIIMLHSKRKKQIERKKQMGNKNQMRSKKTFNRKLN